MRLTQLHFLLSNQQQSCSKAENIKMSSTRHTEQMYTPHIYRYVYLVILSETDTRNTHILLPSVAEQGGGTLLRIYIDTVWISPLAVLDPILPSCWHLSIQGEVAGPLLLLVQIISAPLLPSSKRLGLLLFPN